MDQMDLISEVAVTNTIIFGLTAYALLLEAEEEQESKPRECWVNPFLRERNIKGRYGSGFANLTYTPKMFTENFHMSRANFEQLFSLVEPYLGSKRNLRPDAIPLKAKLACVVEMFTSSNCVELPNKQQHLGTTIDLVCNGICSALSGEFPRWNKPNMFKWAEEFEKLWHFPNCIGAIDGKQGFHSIVLMAVCDASYRFTYIDVGAYGSEGDMNAFLHSKLGKKLLSGNLDFPENSLLNGVPTPYFLVGDDAFPLDTRIMKPYGSKALAKDERIFNYRLSRARRCIENAFGLLCTKWIAVQRPVLCSPDRAQKIVAACCSLHNFMLRTNPREYMPNNMETLTRSTLAELPSFRARYTDYPKHIRNSIKNFVNSPEGSVSWQDEAAGF
ncbi:hypothetical protein ACLKA6_000130 [Drosophila palustris]